MKYLSVFLERIGKKGLKVQFVDIYCLIITYFENLSIIFLQIKGLITKITLCIYSQKKDKNFSTSASSFRRVGTKLWSNFRADVDSAFIFLEDNSLKACKCQFANQRHI